jgi:hypothetical protein
MEPDTQHLSENRIIRNLFVITLLLGIVPFITYIIALVTSALPSYQAWREYYYEMLSWGSGNTAPWGRGGRGEAGSFICYPMGILVFLLPPITILFGLTLSIKAKAFKWFAYCLLLSGFQIAIAITQLAALWWIVID